MNLRPHTKIRLKYGTRREMFVEDADFYEDDIICYWYDEQGLKQRAVISKSDIELSLISNGREED